MIVVSDTSPLNHLIIVDAIKALPRIAGRVVAPGAVIDELRATGASPAVQNWASNPPHWREILLGPARPPGLSVRLGPGEVAAIALALQMPATNPDLRLLIDGRDGREAASKPGLATAGTLAVLFDASLAGLLDLAECFERLRGTNFQAPDSLYDELLRSARGYKA